MTKLSLTQPMIRKLRRILNEKYGESIGLGRHREVWDTGNGYVVKMPTLSSGGIANVSEFERFSQATGHKRKRLAPCKLLTIGRIPLIVMSKVVRVGDAANRGKGGVEKRVKRSKLPKWIEQFDSKQVGYNRRGKLQAFDYSVGC